MLRVIVFISAILALTANSYGQVEWTENPVAENYDGAWGIYAVDMDGDQDFDLVTSAYEANRVAWWENDGNQHFQEHIIDNNLNGAAGVHAGDLDNDGDMDVIGVSHRGNEIAWYENDGQMNFTKYTLVQNYNQPIFARMHDVDNDNDMDIVGSNHGSGDVTWWENSGYPNFTRHDIDNTFDGCRHLDVSDLDDDGDVDILASSETVYQIAWYENDGSQTFQKHIIEGSYRAFWAKPYDFNSDGAMDILGCSAGDSDDISWFENDGYMNFTRHAIDNTANDPQSVEAADFDLDGDLDIVSAARHDNEIAWWENQNNSVFIKHVIADGYSYPITVFPVDIEGDGDWDVATSSVIGDLLTWWENDLIFIPGIIRGVVSDEYADPIESVYVHAGGTGINDYTDAAGWYELALSGGFYDITFQKSGYYEHIAYDISVSQEETTTVDATLLEIPVPCSSCVRGLVTNREAVEIESVYVTAVGTGIDDYTNSAGRYSLEGLAFGTYDISFSHSIYSDTIVSDVLSNPDTGTTLDMVMESNSAVTGVVVDTNSQPIAGVSVNIFDIALETSTDSLGEFILPGLVPGFDYDVSFTGDEFDEYVEEDISVGVNETLDLGTIYLQLHHYEVIVWYGNLDQSPIIAPIGDTVMVDVYARVEPIVGFLHLPLGTNDQYIVGLYSTTEGVLYYPLTDWDDAFFWIPDILSPGWHSQSLLGFSDIGGGPNPFMNCPDPVRIASFAFEVANDPALIGNTVYCLAEGYNPANGEPLFGDVDGVTPYYPLQHFSPFYFVEPNPTEINVWYGNPDSSIISGEIGGTVYVDVYVQSSDPVNLNSLHLPLATKDRYIAENLSDTAGVIYYPLTAWDNAGFLPSYELSPGGHSQSLFAVADTGGASNPYLQCTEPTRIASFALRIAYDSTIVGDTANCFLSGSHPVYGAPEFGDSEGNYPYRPNEFFSSLYIEEPPPPEVFVWYGNPDGSPVAATIGDTLLVDVYVQATGFLNVDSLHLALAAEDQYVTDYQSETAGVLYSPLTEWDDVQFLPPNVLVPGWHSQSLYGVADTGGDPNPYLQCPAPLRIASFALEIVNDISIVGDTVDCLTAGLHPVYGGSFMGDTTASGIYYPQQFFSPLRFVGSPSGGCEYVAGDANYSGDFNGLDITFGVSYFKGGAEPPYACECTPGNTWFVSGDVNGSCTYNGLDITYGVAYFKGGPGPIPCPDCPPAG